jgi:hypothetical protein
LILDQQEIIMMPWPGTFDFRDSGGEQAAQATALDQKAIEIKLGTGQDATNRRK